MRRARGKLASGLLIAALVAAPAAATEPVPFHAFLAPDTSFAAVGSTFVVVFRAGDPAEHFNAYRVRLQFDPSLVEFVSVAEGALMIGGAPFRWTVPTSTDSTVTYDHVLMGAGTYVSGPGELSRFTFRALADGVSAIDITTDPDCTFYDNGLCVNDNPGQAFPRTVTLEGAVAVTGSPPLPAPPTGGAVGLSFRPNPTRGGGELQFDRASSGGAARLVIVDVAGRLVRERRWPASPAGSVSWVWDGRDASGAPVPAGVYFARVEEGPRVRFTRIVRLP